MITEEALYDRYSYCAHRRVLVLFLAISHNIIIKQLHQSGLSSIVLDAAPLELIISLQHTVTKLSNYE